MSSSTSTAAADLIALVPQQLDDLTNALATTYDSASGKEAVQRLASCRAQLMNTCTQISCQLAQLRQTFMQSPQQTGQLLQQPHTAALPQQPKGQTISSSSAPDTMEIDQQQDASEVANLITQRNTAFLSALTNKSN